MVDLTASATPESIVDMVARSGMMAKAVLLLLLVFSVVSWAIILTKFIAYRKARKEDGRFLSVFAQSSSLVNIYNFARDLKYSPVARVFMTGYYQLYKFKEDQKDDVSTSDPPLAVGKKRIVTTTGRKRSLGQSEKHHPIQLDTHCEPDRADHHP